MADLNKARKIAEAVRLSEDKPSKMFDSNDFKGRNYHKDAMLRHGVLISKSVTPSLDSGLGEVCKALKIPRDCVNAFVYNSPDVQADCLIDTLDTCVLRFTSGLVNLMDEDEFKFVAGHELGHFLLGHGACSQYLSEGTSEDFMVRRARELSADRLGYLSIGNQENAIRSIIKTASGLGNQFLRFDVASFMSQTSLITNPSKGESKNSTHPSMLMRCRALLWFAMSVNSFEELQRVSKDELIRIDARIVRDLERFVDGQVRLKKVECESDIALWKSVLLIYHSGAFTNETQKRLANSMGEETLNSIKSFFELYAKDDLLEEISKRLEVSRKKLFDEFPLSGKDIENEGYKTAYKIVEG
jgi:hypothetical protein